MKISTVLIVKCTILITLVNVQCEENSCNESVFCPEIVCSLIKSRKSDFCKDIHCEGIVPQNCPVDSVYEDGLTMCGCCAGCAKYKDVGESCEMTPPPPSLDLNCTDPYCPILKNDCKPGLECNYMGETSRQCMLPIGRPPGLVGDTCKFKRNLGLTGQLHWTPECEADDTYSPKQCKGNRQDGACFCVDKDGNRIFGREWWNKAENQTCGCSRRVHELRKEENIASIHCSSSGDYEELQCDTDSGVCYCVDSVTGNLNGGVLPEHQWRLLPCYSVNVTGGDPTGQYLRQCESQWGAGQRIRKEALLHGLDVFAVPDYDCDYDGSFKALKHSQSVSYCVSKTGALTSHFQLMELSEMNCQCYRDSVVYEEEARPFTKACEPGTGNYPPFSMMDPLKSEYACLDRDGFFYGSVVSEKHTCCLLGNCNPVDHVDCRDAEGNAYKLCDPSIK